MSYRGGRNTYYAPKGRGGSRGGHSRGGGGYKNQNRRDDQGCENI